MPSRFRWTTFDVNDLLPPGWQQEVGSLAADADFRMFPRTPILSREATDVSGIPAAGSTPIRYGGGSPGSMSSTGARFSIWRRRRGRRPS
jgi:hypothetical protein